MKHSTLLALISRQIDQRVQQLVYNITTSVNSDCTLQNRQD